MDSLTYQLYDEIREICNFFVLKKLLDFYWKGNNMNNGLLL